MAALALLALLVAPGAASAQLPPHQGGQWGGVIAWPHVSVSMANLPDGRVLTFASNERDAFPSGPEFTYAATWDPDTGQFKEIPHPAHDMFCASLVMLEDGSVFVSGGRNQADSPWTSIFDFNDDAWVPLEDMNRGRWYPTSVAMPGGEVVIFGGIGGEQHPEMWVPGAGWTLLTGIDLTQSMLQYGLRDGAGLWPLLQLDPDGGIFHAGATPFMHEFDPFTGLGTVASLGPHNAGWFPDEGVSVLFDAGRMLVAGGSISTSSSMSSDQAIVIDINGPAPQITATSPMNSPRQFHNEVLLPTGEVLVVGGNTDGVKFDDDNAVYEPEAWDPATGAWTTLNPQAVPRTYHSTATLLVDGRVLSAGGGLDGGNPSVNHWDGEIFSPPYLFDTDGSLATRPVIVDYQAVARAGATVSVEATAGLTAFSMIKMSATTHTMNTDLRFLRPSFVEVSPGSYELTLHSNDHVLTPGYWILFGLASGVPSEGQVIQIVTSGEPTGPPMPDQRNHVGDSVLVPVVAYDPDGNPLSYSAIGLPSGLSIDPATGFIHGTLTQTGVSNVAVTVDDGTESSVVLFQWFVSIADSEVGTVTVSQSGPGQWHAVAFQDIYKSPVVVMGPPSSNDGAPVTVRVRNVTPTGFEYQLDEWDYLNGAHGSETLSYLVVEAGEHVLPDGSALVAGRAPGVNHVFLNVGFVNGAFAQAPAVLTQAASANGNEAVAVRLRNVSATGFEVRLQEQELGNGNVAPDDVHWIAVEPGLAAGLFESAVTGQVDENPDTLAFAQAFGATPHVLASIQTFDGSDPVALRHLNATANSVDVFVEEETSNDGEQGHVDEEVGWMAIDPSVDTLGLLPLFNQPPTVANPGPQSDPTGDTVSLVLAASDPDGDELTFAATGLPPGLVIDSETGEIQGTLTAAGVYSVSVTVADESFATDVASFDWTVTDPVSLQAFPTPPQVTGTSITYSAATNFPGAFEFTWDFGDGSAVVGPQASPDVTHTFPGAGRWVVTLTVVDTSTLATDTMQFVQMIHDVLAAQAPTASSSIAYEAANDRVWVVNPDNDTVTVIDATSNTVITERSVGANPRAVAVAPDGRIWVVNKQGASIDIFDPGTLLVTGSVTFQAGSQPHGLIFDPAGSDAFVALEGLGTILRLDGNTGAELASQSVGGRPRHLAAAGDGTIYAPRFVSPPLPGEHTATPLTEFLGTFYGGEVLTLDATTLALGTPIVLHHSEAPTTEHSGKGIPNYVGAPAISPDGSQIWLPSKQDNVKRGAARDGQALTFDSTVRAAVSRIDRQTGLEDQAARIDHDDASIVSSAHFGPFGVYLFTALQGTREIAVIDALTKGEIGRFPAARAPQGLVASPDGRTLYVHNFMDRSVTVHDLAGLYDFDDTAAPTVATIPLVANELLPADVLLGKQLFYDAADPRLTFQGYMACAACHDDGGGDGRVWDFTQFGEGLRNTIDLRGRGGDGHGPVHWTANFDEIQDFEGQIRSFTAGTGLMSDPDFAATSDPLGAPKAGLSADLDALAAYVQSLTTTGASPHRAGDGSLTPEALAGLQVFTDTSCGACHSGAAFTDSAPGVMHDVGSLSATSGPQTALDTPTLRGLWNNAPYLHDGSAASLADAVTAHSGVSLSGADLAAVVAYLEQIDDAETVAPSGPDTIEPDVSLTAPADGATLASVVTLRADATDNVEVAGVQFLLDGVPVGAEDLAAPFELAWDSATVADGPYLLSAQARDAAGNTAAAADVAVTVDNSALQTGVAYEYYELKGMVALPDFDSLTPKETGITNNFDLSQANRTQNFAFRFDAQVQVPASGDWTFFTASDDGSQLFIDGQLVVDSDGLHGVQEVSGTLPLAAGLHTIRVTYFERSGPEALSVSWQGPGTPKQTIPDALLSQVSAVPDTTPPSVSLTAPAGGATVAGVVTVQADASDDLAVLGVQFLLNGAPLGAEDTTAPYEVLWDTSTAGNGPHTLSAEARDAATNLGQAANVGVTVDNVPDTNDPSVSLTAPADGATLAGVVTIQANASDDVGVVGVQFLLDGVPVGAEDLAAPFELAWDSATVADGPYLLSAQARDAAGNTAFAADIGVTVDNSALQAGVAYEYYELKGMVALPDFDSLTPKETGTTNNFDLSVANRLQNFALRFDAQVQVPATGDWTFFTTSDDGSQLFIDGQLVVDSDGLHGVQEVSGTLPLTAGLHTIRVTYFERSGSEALSVSWQGPGTPKQTIPDALLSSP